MNRVYMLRGAPLRSRDEYIGYVLIVPAGVDKKTVTAAWSYAIRYTAKGIDVADYPAAVKLMIERHPSWQAIETRYDNLGYDPGLADSDQPEVER